MRTGIDHLVLGGHLLSKADQPAWQEDHDWQLDLQLD